ncbi:MAG: caspase family protein, partial [Paracoccaceae bacterium]
TIVVLAGLGVQQAEAKIRALVIGVSDYAYIDADLRGPANDVGLVADMLAARGALGVDVQVLAEADVRLPDGFGVAAQPTRQHILDGFDALAAQAQAGDTVFVFFSGHGSQAPDLNGDEAGGFDEILLARDTKGWSGEKGLVEGAIVDDELALKM